MAATTPPQSPAVDENMFYNVPTIPSLGFAGRGGQPFPALRSPYAALPPPTSRGSWFSPAVIAGRIAENPVKDLTGLVQEQHMSSLASTASTAWCNHCETTTALPDDTTAAPCWSCIAELLFMNQAKTSVELTDDGIDSETDIATATSVSQAPRDAADAVLIAEGPPIVGVSPTTWPSAIPASPLYPIDNIISKAVRFRGFVEVVLTHNKEDYPRSMHAPDVPDFVEEAEEGIEPDDQEDDSESHDQTGDATELPLVDSSLFAKLGLKPRGSPNAGFALGNLQSDSSDAEELSSPDQLSQGSVLYAKHMQQPMF